MLKISCLQQNFDELAAAFEGEYSAGCDISAEVAIVDEEEIKRLNTEIRKTEKVTDVLSFPSLDGIRGRKLEIADFPYDTDEEGALFIGSVAVCAARAEEQAKEFGHSLEREMNYLVTHGIFHLLGYDHMTEADKAEMRAKEESVMEKLGLGRDKNA